MNWKIWDTSFERAGVPSPLFITASGTNSANGNLCFKVFKLQLKVINKNVSYLCNV